MFRSRSLTARSSPPRGSAFAAPWLAGAALLYVLPMISAGGLATLHWNGVAIEDARFVGLANFRRLLTADPAAGRALARSAMYTAMSVPAQLAVGLGLALLIRGARRRQWWATLFYLPHVLAGVATILVWAWLLNPRVGPINALLAGLMRPLGFSASSLPLWLYSADAARPALVLMSCWHAGGAMLIFLAALLRVPPAQYESAALDGAGAWARFRHVTLPMIAPALLFNVLTGIVAAMQAFNAPFLLQTPPQRDALLFVAPYLYRCAFEQSDLGYAAAVAWLLFAVLLLFSGLLVAATRRWMRVEYSEAGT